MTTPDEYEDALAVKDQQIRSLGARVEELSAALAGCDEKLSAQSHAPALAEALEECLGALTGGMDGKWSEGVDPAEMARAALTAYRAGEEAVRVSSDGDPERVST